MAFLSSALVAAMTRVSIWMSCLPAHPLNALFLKKPKELDLQRQRNFPDFIQKERSATRRFNPSHALDMSAGERAFFVAKQFAFQKCFRESRCS